MTDRIGCAEQCEIPADVDLVEVPRPRHAWADVFNCPNDSCEKSFMIRRNDGPSVREAAADDRRWFDGEKAGE